MASFTYTTTNEGKVKLLAEALGARGHGCSLTRNEDAPGDLMAGGARPFHLRVDSAEAEAALRRLLSPAGDSVGPLPLEPAPDPLAERDRLRDEIEGQRARLHDLRVSVTFWKTAAEKALADLDRQHALAAEGSKQRDALADALESLGSRVADLLHDLSVVLAEDRRGQLLDGLALGREALRKAGR